MGLFSGIKNNLRKAEAAVVVQNAFEHIQRTGGYGSTISAPPSKLANIVVDAAWNSNPAMFDGTYGKRPHKLSIAAYATAYALKQAQSISEVSMVLTAALMMMLNEVQNNQRLFDFNNADEVLLGEAAEVMEIRGAEHMEHIEKIGDGLL